MMLNRALLSSGAVGFDLVVARALIFVGIITTSVLARLERDRVR